MEDAGTSEEDNTTQNTQDTHLDPGYGLKYLIQPGIERGLPGWKTGTLPFTSRRRTKYNYPELVSDTGPGRGMRYDEAPLLKICE